MSESSYGNPIGNAIENIKGLFKAVPNPGGSLGITPSKEIPGQLELETNIKAKQQDPILAAEMMFIETARRLGAFTDVSDEYIHDYVGKLASAHNLSYADIYKYGAEAMQMADQLGLTPLGALDLFAAIAGKFFALTGGIPEAISLLKSVAKIISDSNRPQIGRNLYSAVVLGDESQLKMSIMALKARAINDPKLSGLAESLAVLGGVMVSPSPENLAQFYKLEQTRVYMEQQKYLLFQQTFTWIRRLLSRMYQVIISSIKNFRNDLENIASIKGIQLDNLINALGDLSAVYQAQLEIGKSAFGIGETKLEVPNGQQGNQNNLMPLNMPRGGINNYRFIRIAQNQPVIPNQPQNPRDTSDITPPGSIAGYTRGIGQPYVAPGVPRSFNQAIVSPEQQILSRDVVTLKSKYIELKDNITSKLKIMLSSVGMPNPSTPVGGENVLGSLFSNEESVLVFSPLELKQFSNELGQMANELQERFNAWKNATLKFNDLYQNMINNANVNNYTAGDILDINRTIEKNKIDLQFEGRFVETIIAEVKLIRQIGPIQQQATILEERFGQQYAAYTQMISNAIPGIKLMTLNTNNRLRSMAIQLSKIYDYISKILSDPRFGKQAKFGQELTGESVVYNAYRGRYQARAAKWWMVAIQLQEMVVNIFNVRSSEHNRRIYREAKKHNKFIRCRHKALKDDMDKDAITESTQDRYREYYGIGNKIRGELPYGSKDNSTRKWVEELTTDPTPARVLHNINKTKRSLMVKRPIRQRRHRPVS